MNKTILAIGYYHHNQTIILMGENMNKNILEKVNVVKSKTEDIETLELINMLVDEIEALEYNYKHDEKEWMDSYEEMKDQRDDWKDRYYEERQRE